MDHYSSSVSPLHCVLRTCLVSVAVPLQVPNPRHLVCLQHRSPVWSQQHSSSKHTCSALAQYSHTSKHKVSSHCTQLWTVHCELWDLCVHSSHIRPTCLCKLVTVSHSPQLLLNFAKAGCMWVRNMMANNIFTRLSRNDICQGKMERDWNTLLSSSLSSLPITFLSGFLSNSFQLSLLLLWNKTCLWGKIFLLAPLLVFLVSVYPSFFLFPLCLFTSFLLSTALTLYECHVVKYSTACSLNSHCHALNFTRLK